MADELANVPRLNGLSPEAAAAALLRCCGSARWVEGMLARRPYASRAELFSAALEEWQRLGPADFREAFAHHPEIGANLEELRQKFPATADLSRAEQSAAAGASEATLQALQAGNRAYRARFGYSFIVCATGKSASEMLALLEARLGHEQEFELQVAAAEQAKITRLRLEKFES